MSGDGRSIGTAIGTVGMFAIPGAGEAGAAEDAAKVGQLGELADASKIAEAGDVSKGAEVGDVADASKVADANTASDAGAISDKVLAARQRQAQMLNDNVGYNISPTDWDKYPTIGRNEASSQIRQEWPSTSVTSQERRI